jgi:hypothetical protein
MNPKTQKCFKPNSKDIHHIICFKNESRCGESCYDPKLDDICLENLAACKKHETLCSRTCFNPNNQEFQECINNTTVCTHGHKLCLDACFNPEKQNCFVIPFNEEHGDLETYIKPTP